MLLPSFHLATIFHMEKLFSPVSSRNQMPRIKKYSNVIHFLRDLVAYKKALDPKFTLDVWSAELGFKSRSFLYMVCTGKRHLTPEVVNILARSLKLSADDKEHLLLLSYYQKAKSATQRSAFLNRILENLESNENVLELHQHSQFLSSSVLPLIKLILAFDDIQGTEDELAQLLNLNKNTLKEHLNTLEQMGLVKSISTEATQSKIWKSVDKAFVITGSHSSESSDLYHERTTQEAAQVLREKQLLRRFRSIFFALPEDHFPELLEEIESFVKKLKNKYGYNQLHNKRLMKLNLQTYPVSETLK